MRSFLALMFYIDYKCSSEPRFRKDVVGVDAYLCPILVVPVAPFALPSIRRLSRSGRASRFCSPA